ncbi:MAG TPA: STAS domain-containing protein [Mycobacteriales bacterium]|jgi:anti-anti-sigma factor|nr:STAS domain-containing protein [Mycobacteriales bacterium]
MSFSATLTIDGSTALLTLQGELDATTAATFFAQVSEAAAGGPSRLVLIMDELAYMSSAGLRGLVFARQKMGEGVEIVVAGANKSVAQTIRLTGFDQSVVMSERYLA